MVLVFSIAQPMQATWMEVGERMQVGEVSLALVDVSPVSATRGSGIQASKAENQLVWKRSRTLYVT